MLVNLRDYEAAARRKMLPAAYDYFAGGALDESTLRDNEAAFATFQLRPRALRGVQSPDTRISLCGEEIALPIIVSPTAFHGLAHPDGEVATAAAAGAVGTIMTISTTANCSIDEIAAASQAPVWFQLYLMKDRGISEDLVRAAEAAGCRAVVLTIDVPAWGRRERDMRNGFTLPPGTVIRSLMLPGREKFYDGTMPMLFSQFASERFKRDFTWADVEWLRGFTRLPVFVKGIIRPEDALRAAELGAAGIFVSNHGGRQLDGCIPTCLALPDIAEVLEGRTPIIVDGGIRRGTDVLKVIALGATAAGIGRPTIWGLAAGGREGVEKVLQALRDEFSNAMALCGCAKVSDITRDLVQSRPMVGD